MYHTKRFWTQRELDQLIELAAQNVSTRDIARRLGRTPLAIRVKASRLNLPLTEFGDRRNLSLGGHPSRVRSPHVTANFDLSGLRQQDRVLLFNRLIETTPGLIDVARELIAQAEANRPKAFNASSAATARNGKRVATWRQNREALGWPTKPAPPPHPKASPPKGSKPKGG